MADEEFNPFTQELDKVGISKIGSKIINAIAGKMLTVGPGGVLDQKDFPDSITYGPTAGPTVAYNSEVEYNYTSFVIGDTTKYKVYAIFFKDGQYYYSETGYETNLASITGSSGTSGFSISWAPVSDANLVGYRILRNKNGAGYVKYFDIMDSMATSFTDDDDYTITSWQPCDPATIILPTSIIVYQKNSISFSQELPVANDVRTIFQVPSGTTITLTKVTAQARNGNSFTFNLQCRSNINTPTSSVLNADLVATTTGDSTTSFANAVLPTDTYLVMVGSALDGAVDEVIIRVEFKKIY